MKKEERKPPLPAIDVPSSIEDRIRARAYELYEQRGREDGHDIEDWLHAEAEIMSSKPSIRAA